MTNETTIVEASTELAGRAEFALLDCPFCGGKPTRSVNNDILTVGCDSCLISFANHVRFGCRADAEWNERVAITETGLSYRQAKKAMELFDGEWIGQDPVKLWAWATEEARKAI